MRGQQASLPTFLISFHAVDSESDAVALLSRLSQIPRVMDQLMQRTHASALRGVRAPRFAYEGVIEQAQKVITGAPFDSGADSALWASVQTKFDALATAGKISPARAAMLKEQGRGILLNQVQPAYAGLIGWMKADLPATLVNPTGVSTQPDGVAYYNQRLALMTTTSMTAEQIHQKGLAEVKRLRGEMAALQKRVGFKGDLDAFFKYISTDPQFKFPNTDEGRKGYIDEATASINNIKRQLPKYFGLLPKADLVVKRVEPFREQDGAAQHYYAGTPDGSRPGVYYAHLSDMNSMPKTELEVIAYHEGLPGHHMQISIAQELKGHSFLPYASMASTAYVEGWALYTEAAGQGDARFYLPGSRIPTLGQPQQRKCGARCGWWSTPGCMPRVGPRSRRWPISTRTPRFRSPRCARRSGVTW